MGDIVNLTAGSVDMEVIGIDDKYVRVRLFTFDNEATSAFARDILVKDDAKSVSNHIRIAKRLMEREEQNKKRKLLGRPPRYES